MRLSFGGLSLVLQPPNLLYGVKTGCLICSLGETVGMVRDVHDAVRWVSPRSTPLSSLGAVVRWVSPLGYSQDILCLRSADQQDLG